MYRATQRLQDSVIDASASALEALHAHVAEDMQRVNGCILNSIQSQVNLVPELAEHIISSGGKRLRPLLVLACARLCGYVGDAHVPLAASVEFFHTATLLHDDVVDSGVLRRGLEAANMIWGNKASVLVGDFLLGRAFQMMVSSGNLRVIEILSHTAVVMSEGEVLQCSIERDIPAAIEHYDAVISAKTAELFAGACQIGAALQGLKQAEEQALYSYGLYLGKAFQVMDDVLDYSAVQKKLGKKSGKDFAEGKVTLPMILAYQQGTETERQFWREALMREESEREALLPQAQEYIAVHQALRHSVVRAQEYVKEAKAALSAYEVSPMRQLLLDLADFVVERKN